MGLPLILYDIAPLVNPSFETDADGVSPPTGWTTNRSGTGKAEVDTAQFHPRGSNEGVKSALLNKGNMGSNAYLRQDVLWAPVVGTRIMLQITFRHSAIFVSNALVVRLIEMNGAAELGQSNSTHEVTGSGDWETVTLIHTLAGFTRDGIRVQLEGATTENVHVDYVHLGRVVDFQSQPFTSLDVTPQFRSVVNQGGSAFEAVELADPFTEVRANFDSIRVGSQLETDLMAFYGFNRLHRRFAFWLDRDDSTNEGKHFSECLLTRGLIERHPPGAARFGSRLEWVAPREWVAQEVA